MKHIFPLSAVVLAIAATGCSVTTEQVKSTAAVKTTAIEAFQQPTKDVRPFTRIIGNYIGSAAQPVGQSNSLPPSTRDLVINYGAGTGSLARVARNIQRETGIPVRINPDVEGPKSSTASATRAPTAVAAVPLPGSPLPGSMSQGQPSALAQQDSGDIPLSFTGDLGDYLNLAASRQAISWEYTGGEINFFRMVTKTINVMISPGTLSYRDDVTSAGSAAGGGGGSFGSNSSTSLSANYDPWGGIVDGLKAMVSPAGKYSVSVATGTVVVTDTGEHVARIEKWLKHENESLNRQVAIEVREISVVLNASSQAGIDLNLVYQRLNAVTGAADWAFRFNAPATMVDGGAGAIGFNIARPNSRMAGTNLAIQALNTMGTVIGDNLRTPVTTNRVPVRLQDVTDRAYLAETTPAAGGLTGGGAGVPGLKPSVVTYGDNLVLVPTIGDGNTVLLQLFSTRSTLIEFDSVSTGSGQTLQKIDTPVLGKRKNSQNFKVAHGETLVIVGSSSETWNGKDQHSVTGGAVSNQHAKTLQVLLVTPRIMQ